MHDEMKGLLKTSTIGFMWDAGSAAVIPAGIDYTRRTAGRRCSCGSWGCGADPYFKLMRFFN